MAADRSVRSLPRAVFGPEVSSVTQSRHRLLDFLYDVPEEVRYVAALLVSELTTNVIRHAHTPFSLRADSTPSGVRVEVADDSPSPPVVLHPESSEPTGRGMLLVSELADNWGTERTPGDGKTVWFELARL
jgi:anti-sigma regulatory factor (Ser/Thr protein kinase)